MTEDLPYLTRSYEIWSGSGIKSLVDTADPSYPEIKAMLARVAVVAKVFELTGKEEAELWSGAVRYFDMFHSIQPKEPPNDETEAPSAEGV